MAARRYDLTVEKGATFSLFFIYQRNGVPVDLTSYTAEMDVKDKYGGTQIPQMSFTGAPQITMGSDGSVAVEVYYTDTAAITYAGTGVYNFNIYWMDGLVQKSKRLLQGKVNFSEAV